MIIQHQDVHHFQMMAKKMGFYYTARLMHEIGIPLDDALDILFAKRVR